MRLWLSLLGLTAFSALWLYDDIRKLVVVSFGEVRSGQVIDKSEKRGKGVVHFIKYVYEVDGARHTVEQTLPKRWYDRASISQPGGDPQLVVVHTLRLGSVRWQNALMPGESIWESMWFSGIYLLVMGGALLHGLFISNRHDRWFCRWGRPCVGTITRRCKIEGERPRNFRLQSEAAVTSTYHLHLEYVHPVLRSQSTQLTVDVARYNSTKDGQPITVLIGPIASMGFIVYEFSEFKCVG